MKSRIADAHCDTLTKFIENPFRSEGAMWNVDKFSKSGGILQFFAVYAPPAYSGDSALRFATTHLGNFWRRKDENLTALESPEDFNENSINALLSLEGLSPIIDDISNLRAFYKLGVRAATLTWNHRNFVADGCLVGGNYGLTDFGKEVVREMERLKMIIDVSHLSDAGFWDLAESIDGSFIASHSNSRAVKEHPRNLTDEQIKEIIARRGFIGLNFYSGFLGDEKESDEILKEKLARHAERILELGGENCLGFGADYDGIDKTPFKDASYYPEVLDILSSKLNLSDETLEKIAYKNLADYVLRTI